MNEKELNQKALNAENVWIEKNKNNRNKEFQKILRKKPLDFYKTHKWFKLRDRALETYGRVCMKCGSKGRKAHIQVDHIKPRSKFPHLATDFNNLQVLCKGCNKLKSDWDYTDYRPADKAPVKLSKKNAVETNGKEVRTVMTRKKDGQVVRRISVVG